jgi:hypothetical protein
MVFNRLGELWIGEGEDCGAMVRTSNASRVLSRSRGYEQNTAVTPTHKIISYKMFE